jgi:hypothetical protein
MTVNQEAGALLYDAAVKLLLAYDRAPAARKADITRCVNVLYDEYARVKGEPNLANYGDVNGALGRSASALKRIREHADQLANALVTARQIISAVTPVLALI